MRSGAGNWTQLQLGYPIRKSPDQRSVANSPGHNAGSHVLHRLSMPRHPPCALKNLPHQTHNTHNKPPAPPLKEEGESQQPATHAMSTWCANKGTTNNQDKQSITLHTRTGGTAPRRPPTAPTGAQEYYVHARVHYPRIKQPTHRADLQPIQTTTRTRGKPTPKPTAPARERYQSV
jgi:hypothetical protein